jgi:hypothetical protein
MPIIETEKGIFFCAACLQDKPLADISLDHRYCKVCCDFLLAEAGGEWNLRRTSWRPVMSKEEIPQAVKKKVAEVDKKVAQKPLDRQKGCNKPLSVEMLIAKNVTADVTARIRIMAGQGMGSRAIAKLLQGEGHSISHMTVARRLREVPV